MYLVSDDAGNILLVDPACSSLYEQQMLYRSVNEVVCQQRGLSAESGLTILATHGHLDHLWGAAWACEQWHTPVLMHEADIPMAKAMQAQYDLFGIGGTPVPFPIEPLTVNQSVSPQDGLSAQRSNNPLHPRPHARLGLFLFPRGRCPLLRRHALSNGLRPDGSPRRRHPATLALARSPSRLAA